MSLDLKVYYPAALFNFIFYYNEELAALFCFCHGVACLLWFCLISRKEIRKDFLDRWWCWLSSISCTSSISNYICAIYTGFYIPFGNGFKCRNNKISIYVIFPPSVVILNAPLQGVNGKGVSNLISHLHKCEASLSC